MFHLPGRSMPLLQTPDIGSRIDIRALRRGQVADLEAKSDHRRGDDAGNPPGGAIPPASCPQISVPPARGQSAHLSSSRHSLSICAPNVPKLCQEYRNIFKAIKVYRNPAESLKMGFQRPLTFQRILPKMQAWGKSILMSVIDWARGRPSERVSGSLAWSRFYGLHISA